MVLTVATPRLLDQKGVKVSQVTSETLIELVCDSVQLPDGTELPQHQATRSGYWIYRTANSDLRNLEVWNEAEKQWKSASEDLPEPQTLYNKNGRWRAVIVGAGQTANDGKEKFATAIGTQYPQYAVRCSFAGIDSEDNPYQGYSKEPDESSQWILIHKPGELDRAGLKPISEGESLKEAEGIYLFLKDANLQKERGWVSIKQTKKGIVLELVAGDVKCTLNSSGDDDGNTIVLDPGENNSVHIKGSNIVLNTDSEQSVQIKGSLTVDGTITCSKEVTVNASLSAQSASITNHLTAGTAAITGDITAANLP